MIRTVKITNQLNEFIILDLFKPETTGLLLYSLSGIDPPTAAINTSPKALADGSVFLSSSVDKRNIVLGILFRDSAIGESIDEIRQKTYKYFPVKQKIKMEFNTDDKTYLIDGYVESNNPSIFSKQTGTQVSIICTEPYFRNSFETETNFNNIKNDFEFPFSNESLTENLLTFSHLEFNSEKLMINEGNVETGFELEITCRGRIGDITIYHSNTRNMIFIQDAVIARVTGSELKAGDYLNLNTNIGENTLTLIRDGIEYNVLNAIKRPINWLTIHPGDNLFVIQASIGGLFMDINLKHQTLYGGL